MKKQNSTYQAHLFICKGKSCSLKLDAIKAKEYFKEKINECGLNGRVRACVSTCFDLCDEGPNIMIYPQGVWHSGVQEKDLEEIFSAILQELNDEKKTD